MTLCHLRNVRGFFSDYYLGSVFGRGKGRGKKRQVSDRDTDAAYRRFMRIFQRAEGRELDVPDCREQFIRPLLRDVLGFHLGKGEERIHGLFASAEDEERGEKPLLLVYCGAWDEDLEAGRGSAAPMHRMEKALAACNLGHGFLVTGERIRLVRAPGDGPRGAYLEVDLAGLAAEEDAKSFAIFYRLFIISQYLPDAENRLPIELIEAESREHAEKVSEDLKRAVFTAAESLVSGLLQDAMERGSIADACSFTEEELIHFRDASLTALYRILFILYAEARDPRLLDEHKLYRDAYSVQGLVEELIRDPSRRWPENRASLWLRFKALFRIYDEGLPQITPWEHIPPRGGDFFKSDTPEGRILDAAQLPDSAVARVILDLTTTAPHHGIGRERVSFRELDIEQLGAVYEGLLEYEPRIAKEATIEIRVQGRNYALSPEGVVRLCTEKSLVLKGEFGIVAGTAAEPLHPEAPADEEEDIENEDQDGDDAADQGAEPENPEDKGVKKGAAARLLRRLESGAFHFVPGAARKGSGSFYTPLPLVRDLVRHAVGPLEEGKSASEIEGLRILDPACGSAHFLIEAMRFLGKELHRAYTQEFGSKGPPHFTSTTRQGWDSEWKASDEDARAANSEARAWCKRRIAERCLFGVDLNPTAVGLARVALWIESLAGDRPLTYFEHHVRCGNSLLGSWLARLDFLPLPGMEKHRQMRQSHIFAAEVRKAIKEAAGIRRLISSAAEDGAVEPESIKEQEFKEHQRKAAEQTLAAARLLFDIRSASPFLPEICEEWSKLCSLASDYERMSSYASSRPWSDAFEKVRQKERFFHWEMEFPEVFLDPVRSGFDVILGNPPWDKVKPDKKEFYGTYDILIRAFVGGDLDRRITELHNALPGIEEQFISYEKRVKTTAGCLKKGGDYEFQDWKIDGKSTGGDPDMFKFFMERAHQLVCDGGCVGLVVPSAVYNNEGCTGLRHLLLDEAQIDRFYAFENRRKVFPIDSRYKFVSLVFRKSKPEKDGFEAAFMRHNIEELVDSQPKSWMVLVRKSELGRLSPGTLAFLEYRSPRDREILLKMYEGRPLLGDKGPGTWNARFYTEFHMTNDRDLWTDPSTSKLWNPRQILGNIPGTTDRPPYYDPSAWPEIRARMAEKGFWPLYEGKHIEQWLVDIRPIERWVRLEHHQKKYSSLPNDDRKLVYRRIASNTNERSVIATLIPEKSCFGDSLFGIEVNTDLASLLLTVLNSFSFDLSTRLRMTTNLNFYHMERIAVPQPQNIKLEFQLEPLQVSTKDKHIIEFCDQWPYIFNANRTVAEAYGLTADDFEHIQGTFPVFAHKRQEFYAYLRERVAEWKLETEGIKHKATIYYFPERIPLPKAAEEAASVPYRAEVKRDTDIHKSHEAPLQFKQAAIFTWVVQQLYSPGYPVSRYRAGKMIYLIERTTRLGLFQGYLKQAAGPYDPSLRYRGPEDIAVGQRQWLKALDDTHFEPGPNIYEGLQYAQRYLDTEHASDVIGQFRNYQDGTLSRWTTVDMAANELIKNGKTVTVDAVLAHLNASAEWAHKLDLKDFMPEQISNTIAGLIKLQLFPDDKR